MTAPYPNAPLRQRPRGGLFVRERIGVGEGDEAGRGTLVFLHGLGESGLCFERLMVDRRLAGRRLLAPDLPGYGKSPWPDQPRGFAATVEVLADWLAALDLETVALVGHSMGGVLGADLARAVPERIAAFVNVEGNVTIDDCTASADAAAYAPEAFLAAGFERLCAGIAEGGATDPALRGYHVSLRLCDPRQLHRDAVELVARSRAGALAAETAAVGCPKLYVAGDPRGAGMRSRRALEDAGVPRRLIAGAGHWPYLDQPDAFLDLLAGFLDRALEPARTGSGASAP